MILDCCDYLLSVVYNWRFMWILPPAACQNRLRWRIKPMSLEYYIQLAGLKSEAEVQSRYYYSALVLSLVATNKWEESLNKSTLPFLPLPSKLSRGHINTMPKQINHAMIKQDGTAIGFGRFFPMQPKYKPSRCQEGNLTRFQARGRGAYLPKSFRHSTRPNVD